VSSASTRKSIAQAERLHQPCRDRVDFFRGLRLPIRNGFKFRLGVAARSDGVGAGFAIERHRILHGLEVAAGIDEEDAKRLRACVRPNAEKTGAHVAAGHIGLHDDGVAIGLEHAAAERERLV
jgi:hypothetical protein